jgi:hypothetical protein
MKNVYGNLYAHKTNLDEYNAHDRGIVEQALQLLAPGTDWDLVKLARDKGSVSFMQYPDFFSNPHPALKEYTKINVLTGTAKKATIRKNAPILHRKETFIATSDPHYRVFARLTKQEERAGLYPKALSGKIGRADFWAAFLIEKRLSIQDHNLVKEPLPRTAKTAIARVAPSIPVKLALDLCNPGDIFFDWGCGRGKDIQFLKERNYKVAGWDPYFKPEPKPNTQLKGYYNFVLCSFVLNVLLERQERLACLEAIHDFLPDMGKVLFSARTHKHIEEQAQKGNWVQTKDGWVTKRGTFQKGFTPNELKEFVTIRFQDVEIQLKEPAIVLGYKRSKPENQIL